MKSEDLLKAIGEIDEKFIEEASPQVKAGNENLNTLSKETEENKENNVIILPKNKYNKNILKIVAPIAACMCLLTAAGFIMSGISKQQIKTNDDMSSTLSVAGTQKNGLSEASKSDSSSIQTSGFAPSSQAPASSKDNSESSNSAKTSKPSDQDGHDTYFSSKSTKISSSDVKAIKAGMTYKEIINQLGETANFGRPKMRQYIVDDKSVLSLRFNDLSDVCKKTGDELLQEVVEYKVPESIKNELNGSIFAIVVDDRFISCVNDDPNNCYSIDLSDADIKFANGEPATAADVKPMSSVIISSDVATDSYPGTMHCTSIIIGCKTYHSVDLTKGNSDNNDDNENSSYHSVTLPKPDTNNNNSYFSSNSTKISSSDVKAIKAGMTYKEIINQLGETANFGQPGMRQYIVDNKLVLSLRFNNLSDVCKKTGKELLQEAVPYKVPESIKDKLNDSVYAIVTADKFISCVNNDLKRCYKINLSDAEIKFENGKTATVADVKPMSRVLISSDVSTDSYPGTMHCTKVTILDSNS